MRSFPRWVYLIAALIGIPLLILVVPALLSAFPTLVEKPSQTPQPNVTATEGEEGYNWSVRVDQNDSSFSSYNATIDEQQFEMQSNETVTVTGRSILSVTFTSTTTRFGVTFRYTYRALYDISPSIGEEEDMNSEVSLVTKNETIRREGVAI